LYSEAITAGEAYISKEPSIWGASLMSVSNSFKVSFRLIRTREKSGKIKLSLFPILD